MDNLSKFQKFLIWILSIFFIVSLFLAAFKQDLFMNISDGVFNVVTSIRYTLVEGPVHNANNKLKDVLSLQSVTEENRLLRENVNSIARNQQYIEELENQNSVLEEMLQFKTANAGLDLLSSKVVFRDPESWNNTIKIDVGSAEGVSINDAVILAQGLIGRIESVEENSSIVRLLISEDLSSKVAVKIKLEDGSSVEAIIDNYNANEQAFNLTLLETNDNIQLGDQVVTSGAGGLIPGGISVGEISYEEDSVNQLGSKIFVKSYANFISFDSVFVVKGDK